MGRLSLTFLPNFSRYSSFLGFEVEEAIFQLESVT